MFKKVMNFLVKQTKIYVEMQEKVLACEQEIIVRKNAYKNLELTLANLRKNIKAIHKIARETDKKKEIRKICNEILKGLKI